MKFKIFFSIIFVLSLTTIIAQNPVTISLTEGKNNFTSEEYFAPVYVSELIRQNPQIESISISEYGTTFGYVNTLGGVGSNFLFEPGNDYEIYVNQSVVIYLN